MLVLTRRIGQGVRIYDADGRYIGHIVALGVTGERVKLGIQADSRFVVMRDELLAPPAPSSEDVESIGKVSRVAS